MPTLREIGEFEAIRRLAGQRADATGVVLGSGDDAAVLRTTPGHDLVVTTDAFVEGRHWLPQWSTPDELGARLAAANLSDLAAMAALPRWALLAIGARPEQEVEHWMAVQAGLSRSLQAHGAVVVGGNLSAVDGPTWLSLTLLGEAAHGRCWTRFGARPGDLLAVTGWPGRAGAAVRLVRQHAADARASRWQELLECWMRPTPRVGLAHALAATGAVTAAIDVSDGLLGDLAHLCEASDVGADLERLGPDDPLLDRAAAALGTTADDLRRGPSDDYELLLALDPAGRPGCEAIARDAGVHFTVLGTLTAAPAMITRVRDGRREPIEPSGYDHFGGRTS